MKRFCAIVYFSAAVLVSTHILAPAEPRVIPTTAVNDRSDRGLVASADRVNAQVQELHKRLATPAPAPAPTRDPFRFGEHVRTPRPPPTTPAAATVLESAIAPKIALPRLIAIATNVVDGKIVRSAVLSADEGVQLVETGAQIGDLTVRSVTVDAVEFSDSTGQIFIASLQ
jgi:hypothetical protein